VSGCKKRKRKEKGDVFQESKLKEELNEERQKEKEKGKKR